VFQLSLVRSGFGDWDLDLLRELSISGNCLLRQNILDVTLGTRKHTDDDDDDYRPESTVCILYMVGNNSEDTSYSGHEQGHLGIGHNNRDRARAQNGWRLFEGGWLSQAVERESECGGGGRGKGELAVRWSRTAYMGKPSAWNFVCPPHASTKLRASLRARPMKPRV
jgi:hypothetical protein